MFTAFKLFFSPPEFLRPFGSKRHSRAGGARGGLIRLLCVLIIIPIPVYFRTSALYTLFRRLEQLVQTACSTRTDGLYDSYWYFVYWYTRHQNDSDLAYLYLVEGISITISRHLNQQKGGRKVEDKNSSSTSETILYKCISKERWKMEEIQWKVMDITELLCVSPSQASRQWFWIRSSQG